MKAKKRPNFQAMTVEQLKNYLRRYPAPVSGLKPALVKRATSYFNARGSPDAEEKERANIESVNASELEKLEEKRRVFKTVGNWKSISLANFKRNLIPTGFDSDVISSFLTTETFHFDEEEIASGTFKPSRKGKDMYLCKKIQHCEYLKHGTKIIFRANIQASMSASVFR